MHKRDAIVKTNYNPKKGRFLILKDKELINVNIEPDGRYPLITPGAKPEMYIPNKSPVPLDPPVPNRAWTAMKMGKDIDDLSDEEKRMLYYGKDPIL